MDDVMTLQPNGSDITTTVPPSSYVINPLVVLLSLITVTVNIPLVIVLKRCRKIPALLKWLSMSLVVSTMCYFAAVMMMTIAILTLGDAYFKTLYDIRVMTASAVYCVGCGSTAGLALERYIKLTHPYNFHTVLTKRNIIGYITCLWITSLTLPIGFTVCDIVTKCDQTFTSCDFSSALNANRIIYSVVFACMTIIVLFTSIKITKIVNTQVKGIEQTAGMVPQRQTRNPDETNPASTPNTNHLPRRGSSFRATMNTLKIILIYVIFHIPVILHSLVYAVFPSLENPSLVTFLQRSSFFCTLIGSYTAMYMYIWNFKECKMHFLNLCCAWSRQQRDLVQHLHNEVYDIVTSSTR